MDLSSLINENLGDFVQKKVKFTLHNKILAERYSASLPKEQAAKLEIW